MKPEILLQATLAIQLHVAAAILAFLLGGALLVMRKGSPAHKVLGRIWVGLMALAALSSFFIHTIRIAGPFSPIHLLSLLTLASLATAVLAARRGDIHTHLATMRSLYFGALILAGAFTFLPGRMMHEIVLRDFLAPLGARADMAALVVILGVCTVSGFIYLRSLPGRPGSFGQGR